MIPSSRRSSAGRLVAAALLAALAAGCGDEGREIRDPDEFPGECVVDEVVCMPGTVRSRLICDGARWEETLPCPPDLLCHEGLCLRCVPGELRCHEDGRVEACAAGGAGFEPSDGCAVGQSCDPVSDTCKERICSPGSQRCRNPSGLQICDDLGLRWARGPQCEDDTVCLNGSCLTAECDPGILLVIDSSGSMKDAWPSLTELVEDLTLRHADRRIGLQTFPADAPCGVRGEPLVPLRRENAFQVRRAMEDLDPSGGTPLVAQLDNLRQRFDDTFPTASGNVVVLLTDGGESCAEDEPSSEPAVRAVEALVDDRGVKVYVVGFRFAGRARVLDPLAAAGDTGFDVAFTPDSLDGLEEAFDRIFDDVKACL